MFSFQAAAMAPGTALDRDSATRLADAIHRSGAVLRFERGEWPIGLSQHVDASLRTDEDSEVGGGGSSLGSGFSSVKNGFGVL